MKVYCIDVDGTLFEEGDVGATERTPRQDVIDRVNQLYEEGNFIRIYTARGSATGKDWGSTTYEQLLDAGVKFHEITKKPWADYYVDDRNLSIEEFLNGGI